MGTNEWLVMPGGFHLQQKRLAVTDTQHDVGTAPATTAQGAVSRHHQALHLAFLLCRQATGAVVLHVVGEVLVVVVVSAIGAAIRTTGNA
jgi:hypothetical protein